MKLGSADVVGCVDVHTRNEVDDRETHLLDDETILMRVEEIEAVYASKDWGMKEVDGTACEVEKKVDITEDAELGEAGEDDDEDYDYNLWHDFVGRDCEWDDEKDEDGGAGGERGGGRTNKTNGGVRDEVASKIPGGISDPSSTKGSGSAANKQRTASIMVQDISQGSMTVTQYAAFFYKLEIVHQQGEQALIKLAKEELKEEIREGLETPEFSTLEALFEEASKVKEILEMEKTPPNSPRKCHRNSPDNSPRKRTRKADKKGDPEDEGYYGDPEDQVSDDWGWYNGDTSVDEDEEDMSDDTLAFGQFRMNEYPDKEIESGSDKDLNSGSDA
ncbi:hypothetical protein Bca52824_017775 [Brassica carinata]|uniref:Uncharacterized protein n=1 Tax=Brassica carinata TaxID=52824 RepID=A0A8X7VP95_BRACI|nr:hypothetical protein Bca52824_017775 [Brassica carinata]